MARVFTIPSYVYGIRESDRDNKPYKDLNEVLNTIGVMAKRSKIPYLRVIKDPSKCKIYYFEHFRDIDTYFVPKNWRDCLYEDLETGDFYIVHPDPKNNEEDSRYYSWIAFKVTGLCDGITRFYTDDSGKRQKEILHHTGTFIDLLSRCNINEILDTLAKTEKPIKIKVLQTISTINYVYDRRSLYLTFRDEVVYKSSKCQFDI